ncbi:MAG: ribosome biogenesis GTPase YlqF [Spirochaetales bacterium]
MVIQWFPGHMSKALKMMENEMKVIDVVLYVLDSRAPYSCVNPSFLRVIENKPIIYVLNKSDLSDEKLTMEWAKYFERQDNCKSIMIDSTLSGSGKRISEAIRELLKDKIAKNTNRGIVMPLRAMVIGVPNSGKSTLINNLCGKGKTVTGNKPGVTRGKQWVKIDDNIELLDTPGTLWPSFDNIVVAKHLAYIGSISDNVLDLPDLAFEFIKDVQQLNYKFLEDRYGFVTSGLKTLEIFDKICETRGFIIKGGEYDYLRGAKAILDDFRKARIGHITLDNFENVFEGEAHAEINKLLRIEREKSKKVDRTERLKAYKRKHNKK